MTASFFSYCLVAKEDDEEEVVASTIGIWIKLLLWQMGQHTSVITRLLEMAVAALSVLSAFSFVPTGAAADDDDDDDDDVVVLTDSTSSVKDKKIRSRSSGLNKGSRLVSSSSSSKTVFVMLVLVGELVGKVVVV